MRKYCILCCLLLLSVVPLACSQNEADGEWREVARFASYDVENYQGLPFTVVSGSSALTGPFSVHESRLQVFCVSSGAAPGADNVTPRFQESGTLIVDLYHYPDMRLVKTAVDYAWTGGDTPKHARHFCEANVQKGMYCLWVSGSNVTWAVTVSERV